MKNGKRTMGEYVEKKLLYYDRPIKAIEVYKNIIVPISLVISAWNVVSDLFFNAAGFTADVFINFIYIIMLGLSMFSFSLLDKTAFIMNMTAIAYKAVWIVMGLAQTIISAFKMTEKSSQVANDIAGTGAIFQAGAEIANRVFTGASMMAMILVATAEIAILTYFVFVALQFKKHKKLFFVELKELKEEYQTQ